MERLKIVAVVAVVLVAVVGGQSGGVNPDVAVRRLVAMPDGTGITLRWSAVPGATGYAVYAATEQFGTWNNRARRMQTRDTTWGEHGLAAGTRRFYAVAPIFPAGEGRLSGEIAAEVIAQVQNTQIHLSVAAEDLRVLYSRPIWSNEQVPATAAWQPGGAPFLVRGLRIGGRSTRLPPKKSFRISLAERPSFNFGGGQRRPSDHLNLNAMWYDPSGMREYLAFAHYRALGMAAPSTMPVDLYVNAAFEGHYQSIERVDHEAARGWKLPGSDGPVTLIRDNDDDGTSIFTTYDEAAYLNDQQRIAYLQKRLEYRGGLADPDWTAVLDMLRWVRKASPGPEVIPELSSRFDLDQLIDLIAVSALTSDVDSFGNGDTWWYRPNTPGAKWRAIPWDKDLTFGNNYVPDCGCPMNPAAPFYRGGVGVFGLVLRTPQLRARVVERIKSLSQDLFTREWYQARLSERLPSVVAGFGGPGTGRSFELNPQQHVGRQGYLPYHVDALLDNTERRRAFLTSTFTDPKPWPPVLSATIAPGSRAPVFMGFLGEPPQLRVTPIEDTASPVTVSFKPVGPYTADGNQKKYAISSSAPLRAEVAFYYAPNVPNNKGGPWIGTGTDEFDRRMFVDVHEERLDGSHGPLRTYTNPFSGIASTVVTLSTEKTFYLVLGK